ncbi:hypothetical protein ADK86_17960 [Streptomyces sp. NRRL F-5755]|uniref:hypothetical protein n=1 Tax=Streptomyces sp. NRRL F-5755 TaxID=1519475 RepID=UPI0006AE5B31|nr:hypothetical protein [Streptomyces sp. NRRL F-5755]KOT94604.1 hypothetical protein ADK86_17960 [Streptomyces sp. NRRL F-5755]
MTTIKYVLDTFQGPAEEKDRLAFSLGVLERLARATVHTFRTTLRTLPTAPSGLYRIKADPYLTRSGVYVKVKQVSEQQIDAEVTAALGGTDSGLRATITKCLSASLGSLLGNAGPGQDRRDGTLVTFDAENVIRVDTMMWRYVLDGHGLTSDVTDIFAFGICLSSVRTDEISDAVLRMMVYDMVEKMTWLPPEQKPAEREELYAKLKQRKDPNAQKRARLAALTRQVNAKVSEPFGISVTADGALFLASPSTGTVWRAQPGQTVTRVAGGGTSYADGIPATEAKIDYPTDVAVDSRTGDVVIADFGAPAQGRRGRLLRLATNHTIHLVADGAALPGGSAEHPVVPARLAVDSQSCIHVIAFQYDTPQQPLRLLRLPPGGEGTVVRQQELVTPCTYRDAAFGVAARQENRVLFSLTGCGTVNSLSAGSATLTVVAGGGERDDDGVQALEAKLYRPCGLDLDAIGNLYIADADGYPSRVRKVTPSGLTTTVLWGRNLYAVAMDYGYNVLYAVGDSSNDNTRILIVSVLPARPND